MTGPGNLTIVPVVALDRAAMRALAYAAALGQPALALHVSPDTGEADRFRGRGSSAWACAASAWALAVFACDSRLVRLRTPSRASLRVMVSRRMTESFPDRSGIGWTEAMPRSGGRQRGDRGVD
jgi:hypothetical protein